jgi:hypothetical protein
LSLLWYLKELEEGVEVIVVVGGQGLLVVIECQFPFIEIIHVLLISCRFSTPNQLPKLRKPDRHDKQLHQVRQLQLQVVPNRLLNLLSSWHLITADFDRTYHATLLTHRTVDHVELARISCGQKVK